jgi:hypothetical protein
MKMTVSRGYHVLAGVVLIDFQIDTVKARCSSGSFLDHLVNRMQSVAETQLSIRVATS